MLQAMTCASPPALRMPWATSSQASTLRLEITTFAPSLARSSADERPMPRLEPVTTATRPVRSKGVFFIVVFPLSARHCEERNKAIQDLVLDRFAQLSSGARSRDRLARNYGGITPARRPQ